MKHHQHQHSNPFEEEQHFSIQRTTCSSSGSTCSSGRGSRESNERIIPVINTHHSYSVSNNNNKNKINKPLSLSLRCCMSIILVLLVLFDCICYSSSFPLSFSSSTLLNPNAKQHNDDDVTSTSINTNTNQQLSTVLLNSKHPSFSSSLTKLSLFSSHRAASTAALVAPTRVKLSSLLLPVRLS